VSVDKRLTTRDLALIICFTALYAVFATIPIFRILGMPSASITAAAMTAPIIGVLLGPYVGSMSVALGGAISFFAGSFFPPSLVSGIVVALCAGFLSRGKRVMGSLVYLLFLLALGFYPFIGPAWLFPASMWFQIIGFLVLISPIESKARQNLNSGKGSRSLLAWFTISLTSTLAGQISGSFVYVAYGFPPILGGWAAQWQSLTLLYPFERLVIAAGSAFVGAPLLRVLASSNLASRLHRNDRKEMFP
jgi:hypothetical protein